MTLRNSILLTVAYSAQFSYPLRSRELWLRLLAQASDTRSLEAFVSQLKLLVSSGWLRFYDGQFFLPGHETDISLRAASEKRAKQKRRQVAQVVSLCRHIPWVVGLAVTGSVAMHQARETDDLDFLVVTQPRRLWITRAVLVGISILLGKYRSRKNAHTSGWCFNMWLESSQLALSSDKHTLYTAYEVLQADWVLQVSQVQQMFLQANAWVASVIPLGFNQKVSRSKQVDNRSYLGIFLLMVSAPFIDASNFLAYLLQQWYMRQAMTREVVGFSQAFFHPRDTHRDITLRWRNYLESIT